MFKIINLKACPAKSQWQLGRSGGFSLVELIVYIGIVALVSTSLVLFSIALSNSRQKALVASEVEANTKIVLNYLSRTIRSARSIDDVNSLFDDNQGRLVLLSSNQISFSLNELSRPQVKIGEETPINLSSDTVWLPKFKFTKLSDSQIAIELEVRAGQAGITPTTENFYQTTVKTVVNLRK